MKKTTIIPHTLLVFILIAVVFTCAFWLNKFAVVQHDYAGLPPVPCVDSTKLIVQKYSFSIKIFANNHPVEIPDTIGHDPGKCLRVIYTKDTSGTVYIASNDLTRYTLNDLFEVWHKNFDIPKFSDFDEVQPNAVIGVSVNGILVDTGAKTILKHNDTIMVSYTNP